MSALFVRRASLWLLGAALATASACASANQGTVPPGTLQPDQFLFERGTEALEDERWLVAREYFRELTETYTQSPYRPDAKLGLGDTYLGEDSAASLVLAQNEYQEFLTFFPTHPRADYAQYKLGLVHFGQMRAPGRDQTETKNAIAEFERFLERYPNSTFTEDARMRLREARDRLSEDEFIVGRFYYRIRWYPGAIDRLTSILKRDPGFTEHS